MYSKGKNYAKHLLTEVVEMLRHEIVTEVQSMVEDVNYWTAARITTMANRAMRDLAKHFGIVITALFDFTSVAGEQTIMYPHDLVQFHRIYFGDNLETEIIYRGTRPEIVYGLYGDAETSGNPEICFSWAVEDRLELWFYPIWASAESVRLFYWRQPPMIANNNDEPLIPRDWHEYLMDYAFRMSLVLDKDISLAEFDEWWRITKVELNISNVEIELSGRDTRFGILDNQLRGVHTTTNIQYMFRDSASDAAVRPL